MSGASYFPNLHMQMQDSPDFASDGLPMYFTGFTRPFEKQPRQPEPIDTGDIVEWKK